MLLICATPETIRRGYKGLLEAVRRKEISEKRMQASLRRIAATKSLAKEPLPLDTNRYEELSEEIRKLNKTLEYVYPGESHA